jgi:hypothetical protein
MSLFVSGANTDSSLDVLFGGVLTHHTKKWSRTLGWEADSGTVLTIKKENRNTRMNVHAQGRIQTAVQQITIFLLIVSITQQHRPEARSRNHRCNWKARNIIYSECVCM